MFFWRGRPAPQKKRKRLLTGSYTSTMLSEHFFYYVWFSPMEIVGDDKIIGEHKPTISLSSNSKFRFPIFRYETGAYTL